nr:tail fiber protein [Candidatus Methanomethylophilaceae archaeon]
MAYDPAFPADNAYVKDIPAAIRQKGEDVRVPAGMVGYFAGSSAPTGWLECDGSAVSRTTYADLFTAIGTTYGTGDGATTFNLPDLRGEFLRVLDSGRGIDSGRVLGSAQGEAYKSHNHTGSSSSTGAHTHGTTASSDSTGDHTHTITSSSSSTGAHAHTITSSSNSTGSHAHSASVTVNAVGAHTHTVSGTAASAGAHTHGFRYYLWQWGSVSDSIAKTEHDPAAGNDQGVRDSNNAVL